MAAFKFLFFKIAIEHSSLSVHFTFLAASNSWGFLIDSQGSLTKD